MTEEKKKLVVSDVAAWKKTELVKLPSGNVAELDAETPNIFALSQKYDLALEAVSSWMDGDAEPSELFAICPPMVVEYFVNPKVALPDSDNTVPDGVLSFADISNDDVMWIIDRIGSKEKEGKAEAATFRSDASGDADSADSEDVGNDT